MDLAKIQKMVKRVQESLFRHSNSYFQGMFRSSFKGAGIQFKEHQVYQYGDDVRFIDWSLLAKKDMTYVKTFEEERNVHILCIVPITPSLILKDSKETKIQAILETISFFILMAGKTKDYVDVLVDTNKPSFLRNLQGESGLFQFFKSLENLGVFNNKGEIHYENILRYKRNVSVKDYKKHIQKSKELVFLTDFPTINSLNETRRLDIFNPKVFSFFAPWEVSNKTPYLVSKDWLSFSKASSVKTEEARKKFKKVVPIKVNGQHLESVTQSLVGVP